MMCEQSPPDQLVRDVQLAERAGFDFSVTSDHYQPWLAEQGHSRYAWSILGAAAQATGRIGLMTYEGRFVPNPESFDSATQFGTAEQLADQIACGPEVEEHADKVKPFIDTGFTEVALVQIDAQQAAEFISWAERELLPALREL